MKKHNSASSGQKRIVKTTKKTLRYSQALERAEAHERRQEHKLAEQIYLELIQNTPSDLQASLRLAQLYKKVGRPDLVLPLLQKAMSADSRQVDIYQRMGVLLHELGRIDQAKLSFERALSLQPNSIEIRYNLGIALHGVGDFEAAFKCFSGILAEQPNNVAVALQLAISLRDMNRLKEAAAILQKIVAHDPNHGDAYKYLALTYVDLVLVDEAVACWERVLQLEPENSTAYLHLSHLRRADRHIQAMEKLYENAAKNIDKMYLAFGLGKALEERQCYEQAFSYLREGNRLKRNTFRYSIDEWRIFFDKLKAIFNAEFLREMEGVGIADSTPIFIVGMPRSGTTLAEQILSAHPQVFGGGELKLLPALCAGAAQQLGRPFPDLFKNLEIEEWQRLGRQYIEGLRQKSSATPHITDKLPENFRFIGLISIILPRAKIIHCQRDPIDTCWSNFENIFAEGNAYAYDLEELGKFYSYYRSIMQHWSSVLPERFYTLDYESLVHNSQVEIAKLLDVCNLPFDESCTNFHQNLRVVNTASAAQVKRPINKDSLRRWSHFKEYLTPLTKELGLDKSSY